jgi:hypothetical protein
MDLLRRRFVWRLHQYYPCVLTMSIWESIPDWLMLAESHLTRRLSASMAGRISALAVATG